MRELLAGLVLIIVLGVVGFLYRNAVERPFIQTPVGVMPGGVGGGQACTDEARVCPDGSAVGRTGPNCSFAPCVFPNEELTFASSTIGFVVPSGYKAEGSSTDPSVIAGYTKTVGAAVGTADTITISEYPTPAGETGDQVMLANTKFSPSGLSATSTTQFKTVVIGSNDFLTITTQRFEGVVDTSYFLVRTADVLRFDVDERGVGSWTDAGLNISTLPEHQALKQMLATLQLY